MKILTSTLKLITQFVKRVNRRLRPNLINPRMETLDDISNFVDLERQPVRSIVFRSLFRAKQNIEYRQSLGETPILNILKKLEAQGFFGVDQISYIQGDGKCGNMYTQHPDRLIPFWLRCKEMNLTDLFYQMLSFPRKPDLSTRPKITQCFIDIVSNLNDIENGVNPEGKTMSSTEADFVAFRRISDIRHHLAFLQNAFIIWSARCQYHQSNGILKRRSEVFKSLLVNHSDFESLHAAYWQIRKDYSQHSMKRSYIWHDTDTSISHETPNIFIKSIFSQMYYGAALVRSLLPTTDFDIDPRLSTIAPEQNFQIEELLNESSSFFDPEDRRGAPFKRLQRAFISLNDQVQSFKYYNQPCLESLSVACTLILLCKRMVCLLAKIRPSRYGNVHYLINQLSVYLSVTARVRENDIFHHSTFKLLIYKNDSFEKYNIVFQSLFESNMSIPKISDKFSPELGHGSKRYEIIYVCYLIWKIISRVAPVHLTIADFGSVDQEKVLWYATYLSPSKQSTIFALPERPQHTKDFIQILDHSLPLKLQNNQPLGVLLGKSDQIKQTRAPFYTLALNLELTRRIEPEYRYVGNGSTIVRGGTLTHFSFAPISSAFSLGKTVQQGDGFRSLVNEYQEFKLRSLVSNQNQSFFELIALYIGPASSEHLYAYQFALAKSLAMGILDKYPKEASRSHFKYNKIEIIYREIMLLPSIDVRIKRLIKEVIPFLRAIPETNIAIANRLYPVEQDLLVTEKYRLILNTFRSNMIRFYTKDSNVLPDTFSPLLRESIFKHRSNVTVHELDFIINELRGAYRPPALQFCIDMVIDTLRQIHTDAPIRSSYIQILLGLDPSALIPDYLDIMTSYQDALHFQPI
ncbi:MAG: hypothetical protein VW397_00150 [Candidatus Margulisiibacteriota bacterium]